MESASKLLMNADIHNAQLIGDQKPSKYAYG